MSLWSQWYSVVAPLRAACSRTRSFLWLLAALAGLCARSDLLGVTRIVRTLGLAERCYDRLLDFFHSPALDVAHLTRLWTQRALSLFPVHRFAGRPVLLGDGIKIPKSGRKMPARAASSHRKLLLREHAARSGATTEYHCDQSCMARPHIR